MIDFIEKSNLIKGITKKKALDVIENKTLFPKQEPSAPVFDYYAYQLTL